MPNCQATFAAADLASRTVMRDENFSCRRTPASSSRSPFKIPWIPARAAMLERESTGSRQLHSRSVSSLGLLSSAEPSTTRT